MCLIDRRSVSPSINQCLSPSSWLLSLLRLILLMNKAAQVMMKGAVWHDNSSGRRRLSLLLPSALPPFPSPLHLQMSFPLHISTDFFFFSFPHLYFCLQAVLFDIINKNYDKIKKPRGDGKALIYWDPPVCLFFFLTRSNQHRNDTLHSNNKPALTF